MTQVMTTAMARGTGGRTRRRGATIRTATRVATAGLLAVLALTGAARAQSSSWNDAALGLTSSGTAGGTTAASASCSQGVQQHLAQAEQAYIAGQTAMATGPGGYSYLGANGLAQNSCLSNLLGGLNVGLTVPSLSGLLSGIIGQVCSAASSMENQAIAPLAKNLQAGIPSYEIAPGISTGSANGGLYLNPSAGGSGYGQPVTVNVTGALPQTAVTPINNFSKGIF